MKKALELARRAYAINEVPVGCVIVREGKIIARGYNLRENRQQATAHAEIVAIEKACRRVGYWRLNGCTLYVTLEPCPMCAGAIINARIDRVVFGAYDEKRGCCGSIYELTSDRRFNHLPAVTGGVLAADDRLFQAQARGKSQAKGRGYRGRALRLNRGAYLRRSIG